jgi:hypothetical protein
MQNWQIRLFGRFELTSPFGGVTLPTRQTEGLVAALVLNRRYGLSREDLGQILWPESPRTKQLDNLRQVLAFARKALGHASLECSRTHCRLADGFLFQTDIENPDLRSGPSFLPGFGGEWFEAVRVGFGSDGEVESPDPDSSPISSFVKLLEWYAGRDSAKMLGLLRENQSLSFGLSGQHVRRLLSRIKDPGEHGNWVAFFESCAMMGSGSVLLASRRLSGIAAAAELDRDYLLSVQAGAQVCAAANLQNRFEEANQVAAWCLNVATRAKDKRLLPTATHLQGTTLASLGELDRGLQVLAKAEQMYTDELDSAVMRALRACYLAFNGRSGEADRLNERPSRLGNEAGHGYLKSICSLTQGQIRLNEVGAEEAIEQLESAVRTAETYGNNHLVVPAREALAQAYKGVGEAHLAESEMAQARRIRISMAMSYTPLDSARLTMTRERRKVSA